MNESAARTRRETGLVLFAWVLLSVLFMAPSPAQAAPQDLSDLVGSAGGARRTLTLSAGTWSVQGNLDIPDSITMKLDDSAFISVASAQTVTIHGGFQAPQAAIFTGKGRVVFDSAAVQQVYPQWWGAKGDGVTEDTTAFQSAVNSYSARGGTVFVPDATYLVDGIGVKSNISVIGQSANAVLKQKGKKYCISTNPNNARLLPPVDTHPGNIVFSNLTFRGTVDADGFSEFVMLLDIRGASKVSVSKCNFIGFRGDGVYLDLSGTSQSELVHNSAITISECLFDGLTRDNRNGISVIDGDGVTIDKCKFKNMSRSDMPGAIDFESDYAYDIVKNVTISQNRFENIGGSNIIQISVPGAVGSLDVPWQNITITGNVIAGDGRANGIYVGQTQLADGGTSTNNVVISNNAVRNTRRPFMVFGVKGLQMLNNVFEDSNSDPYLSYSDPAVNVRDAMISGNIFKNLSKDEGGGILVFGTYNLTFSDNIFDNIGKSDNSAGNALLFKKWGGPADYVTIENNTFRGRNTKVPIQRDPDEVTYPEHNTVKGNTFSGASGVYLPASR